MFFLDIYEMTDGVVKRKITASDLFDCNDLSNFISSVVQQRAYRGISGSYFYTCEVEGVRFLTKLCFYRKSPPELFGSTTGETMTHVDTEINILRLLHENITAKNISPCILEMVYYKICDGLAKVTPKLAACDRFGVSYSPTTRADRIHHVFCQRLDAVKDGLAHDKYAFLVLEQADFTLGEYLQRGIHTPVGLAVFKSILFQVMYTVYAISIVYPKFRHNDLHTDNIMLKFDSGYRFRAATPKFLMFNIGGTKYAVPYFGIIAKIIDFGFSVLPEEGVISNIINDPIMSNRMVDNDFVWMFHWITHILTLSNGDKLGRVDKILQHLEPTRMYVNYYSGYIKRHQTQLASYKDMMANRVWDEYKKTKVARAQIYNEYADPLSAV